MITVKELKTEADFESLQKGDFVICEFHRDVHDYPRKQFRFKVFEILEVNTRTKEIILQNENNIYFKSTYNFNYKMFIDQSDAESKLKSVVLFIFH